MSYRIFLTSELQSSYNFLNGFVKLAWHILQMTTYVECRCSRFVIILWNTVNAYRSVAACLFALFCSLAQPLENDSSRFVNRQRSLAVLLVGRKTEMQRKVRCAKGRETRERCAWFCVICSIWVADLDNPFDFITQTVVGRICMFKSFVRFDLSLCFES